MALWVIFSTLRGVRLGRDVGVKCTSWNLSGSKIDACLSAHLWMIGHINLICSRCLRLCSRILETLRRLRILCLRILFQDW